MASTTRRALLGHVAGAAAAALVPSAAVAMSAAEADPCLAFINDWTAAEDAVNAAPGGDEWDGVLDHLLSFDRRARVGEVPDAMSAQGAAAALRKILDFDDSEGQDTNLIRAALAFLEREG